MIQGSNIPWHVQFDGRNLLNQTWMNRNDDRYSFVILGLTYFDFWTFLQTLESIRQWHMNNLPSDFPSLSPFSSWMKRRNRNRNLCLRVWYWLIVRVAKMGLKCKQIVEIENVTQSLKLNMQTNRRNWKCKQTAVLSWKFFGAKIQGSGIFSNFPDFTYLNIEV